VRAVFRLLFLAAFADACLLATILALAATSEADAEAHEALRVEPARRAAAVSVAALCEEEEALPVKEMPLRTMVVTPLMPSCTSACFSCCRSEEDLIISTTAWPVELDTQWTSKCTAAVLLVGGTWVKRSISKGSTVDTLLIDCTLMTMD
jgi:hypothetical protein